MSDGQTWSGGCQCGAVRFAFSQKPEGAHICHCRMCQKAFGNFFAPLVSGPLPAFELTRGTLSTFSSSDTTARGFCQRCGTPLTMLDKGDDTIFVAIGAFDHPDLFPPERQIGLESRLPYARALGDLPEDGTTEARSPDLAATIRATNHQHPDHDTHTWPQERRP